jgi:hypothetical protein
MQVKYLGPGAWVNVGTYGRHNKDQVKPYPDGFAEELLATSKRNQWERMPGDESADAKTGETTQAEPAAPARHASPQGEAGGPAPEDMTVAELIAQCEEQGIEVPRKARKADLIALLEQR